MDKSPVDVDDHLTSQVEFAMQVSLRHFHQTALSPAAHRVARVLAYKVVGGTNYFLLRYKGLDAAHDQWVQEAFTHCPSLIRQHFARNPLVPPPPVARSTTVLAPPPSAPPSPPLAPGAKRPMFRPNLGRYRQHAARAVPPSLDEVSLMVCSLHTSLSASRISVLVGRALTKASARV